MDTRELGDMSLLYSHDDKQRIADLFVAQVIAFKATGQIPFDVHYGLGYTYCCFVITQSLYLGVLFLKTSYDMLLNGKLEQITDALTMTIIFWFSVYAACYWLLRWQRLLAFLQHINHHYWHHSLPGLSFVSSHRTFILAKRITVVWALTCMAGTALYGLAPLVMGVHALPLKCWYPFDPLVGGLFGAYFQFISIYIFVVFAYSNLMSTSLCMLYNCRLR